MTPGCCWENSEAATCEDTHSVIVILPCPYGSAYSSPIVPFRSSSMTAAERRTNENSRHTEAENNLYRPGGRHCRDLHGAHDHRCRLRPCQRRDPGALFRSADDPSLLHARRDPGSHTWVPDQQPCDGCALPDIIFGSLATFIGAIGSYALRKNRYLCSVPPVISNALIIPFILTYAYHIPGGIPFFMLTVGLGEVISCMVLGQILLTVLNPIRHRIFPTEEDLT